MVRQLLIALGLIVIAILGGIGVAFMVDLQDRPEVETVADGVTVTNIVLGKAQDGGTGNKAIQTDSHYTTADQLALRIERDDVSQPVSFNARLVDEDGTVMALSPSRAAFGSGESLFCCWTITTPGEYTLQLFRDGGAVTRLPVVIREDRRPAQRAF